MIYDQKYLEKYVGYSRTDLGQKITAWRAEYVQSLVGARGYPLIDWGCCSGDFLVQMRDRGYTYRVIGVDINPTAVSWCRVAQKLGAFTPDELALESSEWRGMGDIVMTFWDSFEHLRDPGAVLKMYRPKHVIISAPCLDAFIDAMWHSNTLPWGTDNDRRALILSEYLPLWKHYRPEEHLWNFTEQCLRAYLVQHGYKTVDMTFKESTFRKDDFLGDRNIMTLVAVRD